VLGWIGRRKLLHAALRGLICRLVRPFDHLLGRHDKAGGSWFNPHHLEFHGVNAGINNGRWDQDSRIAINQDKRWLFLGLEITEGIRL
jgi:hypothetical protein